MKRWLAGIVGVIGLSACSGELVVVGDASAGTSGAGAPPYASTAGASAAEGGAPGAQGGASGGANAPAECSASPEAYEAYSDPEELNALLVGQWRRCLEPQIPGEDVGV